VNLDVPVLHTSRLILRPFTLDDLEAVFRILDVEINGANIGDTERMASRERWLTWSVLNYSELSRLYQPPTGDRAVVLRDSGKLIGACGFVAILNEFNRIPYFRERCLVLPDQTSLELGLYYAISPAHQRRGYATETARALVEYAFTELQLGRIVATTSYDNLASMAVMRRLGMRIERNPDPDPPYLQVVGVLEREAF
jgi:RimJ/RimL family protein N-acetyltransferase